MSLYRSWVSRIPSIHEACWMYQSRLINKPPGLHTKTVAVSFRLRILRGSERHSWHSATEKKTGTLALCVYCSQVSMMPSNRKKFGIVQSVGMVNPLKNSVAVEKISNCYQPDIYFTISKFFGGQLFSTLLLCDHFLHLWCFFLMSQKRWIPATADARMWGRKDENPIWEKNRVWYWIIFLKTISGFIQMPVGHVKL